MNDAVVLKVLINKQRVKLSEPEFSLIKRTGEHVLVELTGLLNLQMVTGELTIVPEMEIEVYKDDAELPFFYGLISYVDIKIETANIAPMEKLTLKAMSFSCLFDSQNKNRSFQNKTESYESIMKLIIKTYSNSGIVAAPEVYGKTLGTLSVQYQETDWEYLKRLASRLNLPIIPSHKKSGPKMFFGTVWSSTRHQITSDEEDQIEVISQAYNKGQEAYKAFSWTTEKTETEILDIGDIIQYKGIDFYIKEVDIQVLGYEIKHRYLFGAKDIFSVIEKNNPKLTGLSLPGSVAKVSGNQLQVGLDIDALGVSDCWYSYATFYSLFYCMPEIGDRVYLYFPEAQEAAAFVLNSVRVRNQSSSDSGIMTSSVTAGQEVGELFAATAMNMEAMAAEKEVDITPYIDALADPGGGTLVDLSVQYSDGTTSSLQELMGAQTNAQPTGAASAAGSAKAAAAGQNYDFESLANNDKIKVLSTSDGKKIILNDENGSVLIYLNGDTFIQLIGSEICIVSQEAVTFWSDGKISLNAKDSIQMEAEQNLGITCGNSEVRLNPVRAIINSPNINMGE